MRKRKTGGNIIRVSIAEKHKKRNLQGERIEGQAYNENT